jgi:hypothetical protein
MQGRLIHHFLDVHPKAEAAAKGMFSKSASQNIPGTTAQVSRR